MKFKGEFELRLSYYEKYWQELVYRLLVGRSVSLSYRSLSYNLGSEQDTICLRKLFTTSSVNVQDCFRRNGTRQLFTRTYMQ